MDTKTMRDLVAEDVANRSHGGRITERDIDIEISNIIYNTKHGLDQRAADWAVDAVLVCFAD